MKLSLSEKLQALPDAIRCPDKTAPLDNIELRRLKIYQELFYNNIKGFIDSGFPVLRSIYADDQWHVLIREFMVDYRCETPYFLEISQEFIVFLQQRGIKKGEYPFLIELAHYEWVELALDTDEIDLSTIPYQAGDLLRSLPVVSPLAWPLCYQFPVHRISSEYLPEAPLPDPTYLLVYRNRDLQVKFMESNAVTFRLLELLAQEDIHSGEDALKALATEMGHTDTTVLMESGLQILQQLEAVGVILGA